jgi:YfiH family protein
MAQPIKKDSSSAAFITIAEFETGHGIRHFFGTRDQPSNLRSPFDGATPPRRDASCEPLAVIAVKQVHGTDALLVDRPIEAGTAFAGSWDAVITNQPGVLVTVRTADCAPILLHGPIHHVVAAVHSGWRGSVAGIVPKTLLRMQHEFGSRVDSIHVAIGPSAGSCCYEVDDAVLGPLRSYPFWKWVVRETVAGRALLDLREFIRRQTHAAGVPEQNMWTVSLCTICRPDLFYSYRREGVVKERMTSGVMLSTPSSSASGRVL